MTYTNPIYDMFERDKIEAFWAREAKKKENKTQWKDEKDWTPEDEPIMI